MTHLYDVERRLIDAFDRLTDFCPKCEHDLHGHPAWSDMERAVSELKDYHYPIERFHEEKTLSESMEVTPEYLDAMAPEYWEALNKEPRIPTPNTAQWGYEYGECYVYTYYKHEYRYTRIYYYADQFINQSIGSSPGISTFANALSTVSTLPNIGECNIIELAINF